MGKLLHKVEQLAESVSVNLHGNMLPVKDDTVLVIINIGRVLESPGIPLNGNRNNPVILSCRMIHPARIALIFPAEQTLRIARLLRRPGRRNGLGVFFRLGKIDGNVQIAIFRFGNPFHIPRDSVTPDVIRIPAEFVIIIRGLHRVFLIKILKGFNHLTWAGHQKAHDFCVKQIPINHAVFLKDSFFVCIVQHATEDILQILNPCFFHFRKSRLIQVLKLVKLKQLEKPVDGVNLVLFC